MKDSWTSNKLKFSIKKIQIRDSWYFEYFLCVYTNPLLLQKKSTSKSLYIMKIKVSFVQIIMFDGTIVQF
jgi:hypothetical protein